MNISGHTFLFNPCPYDHTLLDIKKSEPWYAPAVRNNKKAKRRGKGKKK